MAGFRTFLTGEVLTAVNVNDFLMKQSVMVFADAAARTAALGGEVAEGMLTFTEDNNLLAVYDGSAFVPLRTTQGYLGTRTYTATENFAKADAFGDSSNVLPRAIVMTLVGGGGGGGGAGITIAGESAAGGGGGAGAVGIHVLDSAAIAALPPNRTITVGTGGAGGSGAAAGSDGGVTIFGFSSGAGIPGGGGGGGGAAGAATAAAHIRAGGLQGVASACNVENMRGSGGFASLSFATTVTGGVGGQGGGNALAGATASVNDDTGRVASFPGGGGGGARNPQNRASTRAGAAGKRGLVIMDIYI